MTSLQTSVESNFKLSALHRLLIWLLRYICIQTNSMDNVWKFEYLMELIKASDSTVYFSCICIFGGPLHVNAQNASDLVEK